jgi:hypothetical protein
MSETSGVQKEDKQVRFNENGCYESDKKKKDTDGQGAVFYMTILDVNEQFEVDPQFIITIKSSHKSTYKSGTVGLKDTFKTDLPTNGEPPPLGPEDTTTFSFTIQSCDGEKMSHHYFHMKWELDWGV